MTKLYLCPICGGPNTKRRAWKGKPCQVCALTRYLESARAMREKSGPVWERWRRNWEAATGLRLED